MAEAPPQNLHSARSPDANNPFAVFKCCCRHVRIQQIARPVAILSFIVFIASSIMLGIFFGWFSLLVLVIGAVVYVLLFQAVYRMHHKNWVLAYIAFEVFTIGMLIVVVTTFLYRITIAQSSTYSYTYIDIPLLFVVYVLLKLYFTTVFIQFYRYLAFAEHRLHQVHAQYVNGGVHISADQIFPPPPPFSAPNLPVDHPTRDPDYGYAIPYVDRSLTQAPNYSDATSTLPRKEPPTVLA